MTVEKIPRLKKSERGHKHLNDKGLRCYYDPCCCSKCGGDDYETRNDAHGTDA